MTISFKRTILEAIKTAENSLYNCRYWYTRNETYTLIYNQLT
ncbi:hypothetical protein SAMN05444397_10726 [Flavobacterium aquidurense]|nr:hypothetical protein SAMN05444397_10726 [Flavobacterium aquidurense]